MLIKPGAIVTDIRGKVGGQVFQHSAAGLVLKNKSHIVNKSSIYQVQRRAALSRIQNEWQQLYDLQRMAWMKWAAYQNIQHGTFTRKYLTGQNAFTQINQYLSMLCITHISNPIFSYYSLPPAVIASIQTGISLRLIFSSLPNIADHWIVAKFSGALTPSARKRPRSLKFCIGESTTEKEWDFTNSYLQNFGYLPPAGLKVYVKIFLIQKSNYTIGNCSTAQIETTEIEEMLLPFMRGTIVRPVLSGYAWHNQGPATVEDSPYGLYMETPGDGDNLRILSRSLTGLNSVNVCVMPTMHLASYNTCGVLFRESLTGKLIIASFSQIEGFILIQSWTDPQHYSRDIAALAITQIFPFPIVWLRLRHDATNMYLEFSRDGYHFFTITTLSKAGYIYPDQYGLFVGSTNVSEISGAAFFSLEEK